MVFFIMNGRILKEVIEAVKQLSEILIDLTVLLLIMALKEKLEGTSKRKHEWPCWDSSNG